MKNTTRRQLHDREGLWEGAGAKRRQPASVAMIATLWEPERSGDRQPWRARRVSEASQTKSKVVPLPEATFLGFSIIHRKIRWTEKSHKKLKAEVRRLTQRTRGHSPVKVIADLLAYLRGAVKYYALGIPFGEIRALDQWLRRRMRL